MLVSIIIPVYNVEQYITACLETVLQQTYRQLEVILVDDCTQDASMKIAKEYIENSPLKEGPSFVYLQHEKNRGLSASRNTGIDCAKGDYLYFLDSDDTISPDCIEKLVKKTNNGKVDVVCGAFNYVGDNIEGLFNWNIKDSVLFEKDIIIEYTNNSIYPMAWNKLVRSEVVRDKGLYFCEGILHEDELWSYKVALSVNSMALVGYATYFYLIREGSIMTSQKKKRSHDSKMVVLEEMNKIPYDRSIESVIKTFLTKRKTIWMSHIIGSKELSLKEKLCYIKRAGKLIGGYQFLKFYIDNYKTAHKNNNVR